MSLTPSSRTRPNPFLMLLALLGVLVGIAGTGMLVFVGAIILTGQGRISDFTRSSKMGDVMFYVVGAAASLAIGLLSIPYLGRQLRELRKSERAAAGKLLMGGLYQSARDNSTAYLRFYDDKTVIAVSSTGTPSDLASWFYNGGPKVDTKGTYTLNGTSTSFTSWWKCPSPNCSSWMNRPSHCT